MESLPIDPDGAWAVRPIGEGYRVDVKGRPPVRVMVRRVLARGWCDGHEVILVVGADQPVQAGWALAEQDARDMALAHALALLATMVGPAAGLPLGASTSAFAERPSAVH